MSRNRIILVALLALVGLASQVGPEARAEDRREVVRMSRVLLGEAKQAFVRGDTDTAVAKLDSVLLVDPANPDAHYFLGAIRLNLTDTTGAKDILLEGVEKAPLSRRLKLLLARVHIARDDVDEAERLVAEVTALRARDLDAIYLQGLIALARGDSLAAASLWDEALASAEAEAGH